VDLSVTVAQNMERLESKHSIKQI